MIVRRRDVGRLSDCDDQDAAIYPGASETPDDSRDSDCDGFDGTACPRDPIKTVMGICPLVFSADDDCLDLGESESRDDCDDQDATISLARPILPTTRSIKIAAALIP